MHRHLLPLVLIVLMISSCGVHKRVHMPGYHFSKSGKIKPAKEASANIKNHHNNDAVERAEHINQDASLEESQPSMPEPEVQASASDELVLESPKKESKVQESLSSASHEAYRQNIRSEFREGIQSLQQMQNVRMTRYAIWGFISSIVGLVFFAIVFGTLAIVFGVIGFRKVKNNPDTLRGSGLAIASVIIGLIDLFFWMVFFGFLIMP
jgi:hypothetical protein